MSNNNKDEEEEEEETEEELKRTRPGSKMVSPTTAIVVGLVAGLVAWTGKGWKEVRRYFISVLLCFTCFLIPSIASFMGSMLHYSQYLHYS